MTRFLFLLLFSCFFYTQFHAQARAQFPDFLVSGTETKVYLENADSLSSVTFNGQKLQVQTNETGKFIEFKVPSDGKINFGKEIKIKEKPAVIPAWMSILPPLIAILLALILKEVLVSLFLGIYIGSAIIGVFTKGFIGIFTGFFSVIDTYIIDALVDADHIAVIVFSVIIGSIVALISKNGGMQGVVNRIIKFAYNRKTGMMTTYLLGIAIFFDDYANTLVVGNTMRSVTDRLRISREKLAYLVDSTAAPVAAIAFVTTWIGAELGYISTGIDKINADTPGAINEGAYSFFVNSLQYSFYPIFTLGFMYFLIKLNRDYGPMHKFEQEAIENGVNGGNDGDESTLDTKEFEPVNLSNTKAYNAILPIAVVVMGTIIGLLMTGFQNWRNDLIDANIDISNGVWSAMAEYPTNAPTSFFQKLGALVGAANSYTALLWASLAGLGTALLLTVSQRIMKLQDSMETVISGVKTMIPAVMILVLAWSLASITKDLDTANFMQSLFGDDFTHVWIVPAITFILAAIIAFSTGSSWSTMAILYPIMIPTAFAVCQAANIDPLPIMYNTVASVLAGAVLGDHCSPISDTTILSSLASSCNHINHVKTQMPYALTVGGIALVVGIIPGALGVPSYITMPLGLLAAYLVIKFVGKPNKA